MQPKYKNPFFIGGALFILVFLVLLIFNIVTAIRQGILTATINFIVVPSSAEIIMNDEHYQNGECAIAPGDYKVEIKHDGFESYYTDFSIAKDETKTISIMLEQTDGADWLSEHPEDAGLLDPIKSNAVEQSAAALAEKYPLITKLPINIDFYSQDYSKHTKYSVSYRLIENSEIVVTITDYTGGNRADALEKIRARGFDPKDYEIEYIEDDGFGYAE